MFSNEVLEHAVSMVINFRGNKVICEEPSALQYSMRIPFRQEFIISQKEKEKASIEFWKRRMDHLTYLSTMFENHRKSLIQHCERSELRLHFEWPKVS